MKQHHSIFTVRVLLLLAVIASGIAHTAEAQEKQRIAVIPFNPINVSKDQAEVIYGDFERALIDTDAYVVIEREQVVSQLGEGQELLFSCTSDARAIQIAEELAGNQALTGILYRDSDLYVLEIRLLEVADGRTIYIESTEARYFSELRNTIPLLAHKTAGLVTYMQNSPSIARRFTEVFVETIPSRATIYVNGIRKGISPDIVQQVPIGPIEISAQYGNFYGEKSIFLTEDTGQLLIECQEAYGSLVIRADPDLDVILDGRWLGKAGGRFTNVSVGIHTVELEGGGRYWRNEVMVRRDKDTPIQPDVQEYGGVQYGIPEGAIAEIRGDGLRQVVQGYGTLSVPAGRYSASIVGKNYSPHTDIPLSIVRGATVPLFPELLYTREYQYQLFVEEIEEAERIFEFGYRITNIDLNELKQLKADIEQSERGFFELVQRVETLIGRAEQIIGDNAIPDSPETVQEPAQPSNPQMNALLVRKQELALQIESRKLIRKKRVTGGWVSFSVGAVGVGAAGVFYFLGNDAFRSYQEQKDGGHWAEAEYYKQLVKVWDIAAISAIGVGGASLLVSAIFWISGPSTKDLETQLETVDNQINLMQNTGE